MNDEKSWFLMIGLSRHLLYRDSLGNEDRLTTVLANDDDA